MRERLIKEQRDLELLVRFAPVPSCDVERVNREADAFGTRGIVRGAVPGFPIYGQPGCWQDAAVLFGIEALIVETFDDPGWVMELLGPFCKAGSWPGCIRRGVRASIFWNWAAATPRRASSHRRSSTASSLRSTRR